MVKKIRVIDEVPSSEDAQSDSVNSSDLQELAKSMDWKLWEILQIMQRLEKKLGNISIDNE
tara:strand:+ start:1538 stop:1720 length:183 start_codon:yes stop_codon:yes gene_type:complete